LIMKRITNRGLEMKLNQYELPRAIYLEEKSFKDLNLLATTAKICRSRAIKHFEK